MPTYPVPPEQRRRFGLAMCERLGLDPELVGGHIDWHIDGDEDLGKVTLDVFLPAAEILAMWNGVAPAEDPS